MLDEPLQIIAWIARALEPIGIKYLVGGSVASSLYGEPRSTLDIDLVVALRPHHVERVADALESEFWVDRRMMREAAEQRASFNIFHRATMLKVDIFVQRADPWSQQELRRAQRTPFELPSGTTWLWFASPEDILLYKLVWYRIGNEVSDRQWRDILGILEVQSSTLNQAYLNQWAPVLGVRDLLERARSESQASG